MKTIFFNAEIAIAIVIGFNIRIRDSLTSRLFTREDRRDPSNHMNNPHFKNFSPLCASLFGEFLTGMNATIVNVICQK